VASPCIFFGRLVILALGIGRIICVQSKINFHIAVTECSPVMFVQGHPFMESLRQNWALLYTILISGGAVFALALGIFPDVARQFEIVEMPSEVSTLSFLLCTLLICESQRKDYSPVAG